MNVPPAVAVCFSNVLAIPQDQVVPDLAYNSIRAWDSVAHMALVAELEGAFGVMMDTDDIMGLSTVAKAVDILTKLGVTFDAA